MFKFRQLLLLLSLCWLVQFEFSESNTITQKSNNESNSSANITRCNILGSGGFYPNIEQDKNGGGAE